MLSSAQLSRCTVLDSRALPAVTLVRTLTVCVVCAAVLYRLMFGILRLFWLKAPQISDGLAVSVLHLIILAFNMLPVRPTPRYAAPRHGTSRHATPMLPRTVRIACRFTVGTVWYHRAMAVPDRPQAHPPPPPPTAPEAAQRRHARAPRNVFDVAFADTLDLRHTFFELVPLPPPRANADAAAAAAAAAATAAMVEATIPMPFDEYPYDSAAPTARRPSAPIAVPGPPRPAEAEAAELRPREAESERMSMARAVLQLMRESDCAEVQVRWLFVIRRGRAAVALGPEGNIYRACALAVDTFA